MVIKLENSYQPHAMSRYTAVTEAVIEVCQQDYRAGKVIMSERVDDKELIKRVAARVGRDEVIVEEIVAAALEEIYGALKQGQNVSLRNFGTFYVRPERESWVFRFNPSQRWRKLFGWSSTYKGKL